MSKMQGWTSELNIHIFVVPATLPLSDYKSPFLGQLSVNLLCRNVIRPIKKLFTLKTYKY